MEWIIISHAMVGRKLSSLLQIPHDSLISGVVLVSMLLQVLLIFLGGIRYRSAKFILSSVTWMSYLSANYVAIYALGLMLQTSLREIGILYAVWAPLLLVHLGGPDTITAYSMIDNELWKRHALVMFYHLFVAAYLISVSLLPWPPQGKAEWSLSLAAILIYLAGATKYLERVLALRFASIPQIVSSTLPIHTFMEEIEHKIEISEDENKYNYIVSGEREFFQEYRRKMDSFRKSEENSSKEGDTIQMSEENLPKEGHRTQKSEENSFEEGDKTQKPEENLSEEGESSQKSEETNLTQQGESSQKSEENFLKENFSKEKLKEMGVVTVGDVWEFEHEKATEDYMLCVSHALFKSYMRRFGGLRIREGNESKTRKFFFKHLRDEKVFKVVERELKFTYDYLFSKSSRTAFSRLGTAMRFTNTCLLAGAFFLIYNTLILLEGQQKHGHNNLVQRVVTYILVSVAAVLEMFQLCRIMLSDWTRVWLVCAIIRHSHPRECADTSKPSYIKSALRNADTCMTMVIKSALLVAKCVQMLREVCCQKLYWQNQIQQYSLTGTCLTSSAGIENVRCLTCASTSKDKSPCLSCTLTCKQNRSGCTGKALCLTCTSNCTHKAPAKRKGRKSTPFILKSYIKAVAVWHMKPKPIDDELKHFILGEIKEYCYEKKDGPTLPSRLLNSIKNEIYKQVGLELNTETWEREILKWHVATAICQGHDEDAGSKNPDLSVDCGLGFFNWNGTCVLNFFSGKSDDDPVKGDNSDDNLVKKNMRVSETLSNYSGYLMVSYPSMLPLHPDMAKLEHEKLLLEIVPLVRDIKKNKKAEEGSDAAALAVKLMKKGKETKDGSRSMLSAAAALAEKLMDKEKKERWELISQLWSAFVLYYAYFYKATFHGGSLAAGGEYISQLWALLAHLGFGEQSDTAVGHRGGSVSNNPPPEEVGVGGGEMEQETEERETKEEEGAGEIKLAEPSSAKPFDLEKGELRAKRKPNKQQ